MNIEARNALDVIAVLTESRPGNVRLSALDTLTRALKAAEADARALWAVRVLDAWQRLNPDSHAFATCYLPELPIPARKWKCVSFSHSGMFFGPTPDAAREAAALAVWPELPADVRAEIGERP